MTERMNLDLDKYRLGKLADINRLFPFPEPTLDERKEEKERKRRHTPIRKLLGQTMRAANVSWYDWFWRAHDDRHFKGPWMDIYGSIYPVPAEFDYGYVLGVITNEAIWLGPTLGHAMDNLKRLKVELPFDARDFRRLERGGVDKLTYRHPKYTETSPAYRVTEDMLAMLKQAILFKLSGQHPHLYDDFWMHEAPAHMNPILAPKAGDILVDDVREGLRLYDSTTIKDLYYWEPLNFQEQAA